MRISLIGKLIVAGLTIGLGGVVGCLDVSQTALELPAALLLASGVLLGALNPRLAWLWAAVMGLCLVSARAFADALGIHSDYSSALLPLIVLPLAIAVMGVVAGSALRRLAPEAP